MISFETDRLANVEIVWHVIIYPHPRELFAFPIREAKSCKSDQMYIRESWTT